MTLKQFQDASMMQDAISDYYNSLGKLDDVIDKLKTHGKHDGVSIQINGGWSFILENQIDYSDLLDFLTYQRNKISTKIEDTQKEFAEL